MSGDSGGKDGSRAVAVQAEKFQRVAEPNETGSKVGRDYVERWTIEGRKPRMQRVEALHETGSVSLQEVSCQD